MIACTGLGYLVAAVTFALLMLTEFVTEQIYHNDQYFQTEGWPILLAFLLSGLFCRTISKIIEKKEKKTLIDVSTGEIITHRPINHTLIFIPIRYWTYLMPAVGLVFYTIYTYKK